MLAIPTAIYLSRLLFCVQVSFHSAKLVKKVKVPAKVNEIVNRLNRTKKELYPDLCSEKEAFDREVREEKQGDNIITLG